MFTAIQTKFQRHYKILFFIMLVVVIIAFVFTIGAAPGLGGDRRVTEQEFFGYNIASERDQIRLLQAGQLSFRMEHGDLGGMETDQLWGYSLQRLAYLGIAEEMSIPGPTEADLRDFIFTRAAFHDQAGNFDRAVYAQFSDEIEADPQRSVGDVLRVLEEDYRIEAVRNLTSGPGYVHPAEVRRELERNQTLWTVELASYDLGAFEPEVEFEEEELVEFFNSNPRRYERPAQTVFSYVEFDPADFRDRLSEPSDEELAAYFERHRDRFVDDSEPAEVNEEEEEVEEEEAETTLADVREEVVEAMQQERARRLANQAASDFAYALFDQNVESDSEQFPVLIDEFGGSLEDAPPASPQNFPQELGFPWEVQQEVFRLAGRRYFSDAHQVNNRFIVLIYRETIDPIVPPLEEVRDRVVQDFEAEEERRLLVEAGNAMRERLQSRLNEGESFEEAAEAEDLQVMEFERFSRVGPPENLPPPVLQRLDELRRNRVSPMIRAQNYGYFAILKDKEVPEIDPDSGEFRSTAEQRKSISQFATPSGVVNEFVERRFGGAGS